MPKGKVKRVIDGDTFELRSGERVRIAGLNTPELDERGGQQAKRRLQSQMPRGTEVGLSKPLAKSYGRVVRKVTVNQKNITKLVSSSTHTTNASNKLLPQGTDGEEKEAG